MANELQWRGFLTVQAQPWFSADTKAELETYTANVAAVEQQRAEVDAERAALAAIPVASGANSGAELASLPGRSATLKTKRLQTLHAEISARSTFQALIESASKDAGAEATRLEQELSDTDAKLREWLQTGPEGIGGYLPFNGDAPTAGAWLPVFLKTHPRILALRAAIDDCVLPWAGDFLRKNSDDAEQARQKLEAGHAALLAV